ncbi:DUF4038 domain-containing protein [Pelagicoccus mobilis]
MAKAWEVTELKFEAQREYGHAYLEVEMWAEFKHSNGDVLKRPAFWDYDNVWRIRFASPLSDGSWRWESFANVEDEGLAGKTGSIEIEGNSKDPGLLRMSSGGRNAEYSNGTACMLVADTAWALPWRATLATCRTYAEDRQRKGFNAALLMSVQPDMHAVGPEDREAEGGFAVGFSDLPLGHINELKPEYFQYFDQLVEILLEHGIVPVFQPVFQGYGWKGLSVAGQVISGDEYARYCRYLVARYGASRAIYLVGGDGYGTEPGVRPGGKEIETWDCYSQPAGIHYNPMSANRTYQEDDWLDFQWCQSGHDGEHRPDKVADMWRNEPKKGVANGEPTYEEIGSEGNGAGWWQGHEAWINLCAGGTMGVFYGAGSLWNWIHGPDEAGHERWCKAANAGWREALAFEGSSYMKVVKQVFEGQDFADMEPRPTWTLGKRCLGKPGKFAVVYLERGGSLALLSEELPEHYALLDAKTGEQIEEGKRGEPWSRIEAPRGRACVVVFN